MDFKITSHAYVTSVLLVITTFVLSSILVPQAYATVDLNFENATYFADHTFRITVTDTTITTSTTKVHVTVPGLNPYDFTLVFDPASNTYISPNINFTTVSGAISNDVMLAIPVPSPQVTITASYPVVSPSVTKTAGVISSEYGVLPTPPPSPLVSNKNQVLWSKKTDCTQYGGDDDNDGICNSWEDQSSYAGLKIPYLAPDANGNIPTGFYKLPCNVPPDNIVCPGSDMPDIYVQLDWMKGHKPTSKAIADVVNSFANSPVKTRDAFGNYRTGIRLHVIMGNELPFHLDKISAPVAGGSAGTDFDNIKNTYFGTALEKSIVDNSWPWQENLTSKKQVFHYSIFAHSYSSNPTSSGSAETPGNDFIITLGKFSAAVGSIDQQEGTFMHELGHNLGLDHGGPGLSTNDDLTNCKPNYLSVMSYSRQFNESYPINRTLDYSHNELPQLNEGAINERVGLGKSIPTNLMSVYGVPTGERFKIAVAANTTNLKLWLPFDNNFNDASILANNGILTGTANYVLGKVGNSAFQFDGSSFISIPNESQYDFAITDPFRISFWFNGTTATANEVLVTKTNTLAGQGWTTWIYSGDQHLYFTIKDSSGVSAQIGSANAITDKTWHHVIVTYDGSQNRAGMKMYIDNKTTVSGTSLSISGPITNDFTVGIGGIMGGFAKLNNGAMMDNVQILNYAADSTYNDNLLGDQQSNYQRLSLALNQDLGDSSGNGDTVGFSGTPTYVPGVVAGGKALRFDSSTFVAISNTTPFNFERTNPFSISFWFNGTTATANEVLVTKTNTLAGQGWTTWIYSGDQHLYFTIKDSSGVSAQIGSANAITDKTWHHVIVTYDGSQNRAGMKMYIDNNPVVSGTSLSISGTITNSFTVGIGGIMGGFAKLNNGAMMDNVQILGYAVASNSRASLLGGQSAIIDANGNGITDSSSSGNLNYLGFVGCDGTGPAILKGYNDWGNLTLSSRDYSSWDDGMRAIHTESTPFPPTPPPPPSDLSSNQVAMSFSNATDIHWIKDSRLLYTPPVAAAKSHNVTSVSEFTYPTHISRDRLSWLLNWLYNFSDHFPHNKNYTISNEITSDDLREIRSSRILSLDHEILVLPDSQFYGGKNDKDGLHAGFVKANDFINQDNLFNSNQVLSYASRNASSMIKDDNIKNKILSSIASEISSINTASKIPESSKFGATVELDQKVYTWTDRVYITVVAPDHNVDPNLIDAINVNISTREHSLNSYKLTETGVDTGIFTGYVILTGDPNVKGTSGVNGSGLNPTGTTNSGIATGPTDGFLGSEDQDGVSVSFSSTIDETVTGSALIKWNIGQIKWLETSYPANGQGVLQIVDPDMNLNPKAVDKFDTNVWSDSDSGGIKLTMTETGQATGIFQGTVYFTTTLQSSGNRLHVAEGDTVTGEYKDRTLPPPYTPSDQLRLTTTTFSGAVVVPPVITTKPPKILNSSGSTVTQIFVDKPVLVSTDVTNGKSVDQPFAYVVQIQDSNGVTVAMSWVSGTISAGQTISPAQSWIPQSAGSYTVQTFLWQSVDNPTSLAPAQPGIAVNVIAPPPGTVKGTTSHGSAIVTP